MSIATYGYGAGQLISTWGYGQVSLVTFSEILSETILLSDTLNREINYHRIYLETIELLDSLIPIYVPGGIQQLHKELYETILLSDQLHVSYSRIFEILASKIYLNLVRKPEILDLLNSRVSIDLPTSEESLGLLRNRVRTETMYNKDILRGLKSKIRELKL